MVPDVAPRLVCASFLSFNLRVAAFLDSSGAVLSPRHVLKSGSAFKGRGFSVEAYSQPSSLTLVSRRGIGLPISALGTGLLRGGVLDLMGTDTTFVDCEHKTPYTLRKEARIYAIFNQ